MLQITKDEFSTRNKEVIFSIDTGEIVGRFILDVPHGNEKNGELSIWNLRIYEEYRGRKLCNQMMVEAVEMMKEKFPKAKLAYLTVLTKNIPAIKAYTFAGFKITQTDEDNWMHRMEISLR